MWRRTGAAARLLGVWLAALAWAAADNSMLDNSTLAPEGELRKETRDNNITALTVPPLRSHGSKAPTYKIAGRGAAKNDPGVIEDAQKFSMTVPIYIFYGAGRVGSNPKLPAYNVALVSSGPGFLHYAAITPKFNLPSCLLTHYTRRFRANYTQNQPAWMSDAISCHTIFIHRSSGRVLSQHVPDVPCPYFQHANMVCHLLGDHIAVQPWEKWADYSFYVDVLYSNWAPMGPSVPYGLGFGRTFIPVRIHNCDPTKDCFTFPRANWTRIGFDFSTTDNPKSTKSKIERTTTTTTPRVKTLPPLTRTKKIKSVCPGKCKSRRIAEILWPIFFVTTLLVLFGVLPCIYLSAKKRTEKELIRRWYRASSATGGTNFLLRVPPTWVPGWPPGPSTGEPSRTDPEGRWRSAAGPPPAKRRRRR